AVNPAQVNVSQPSSKIAAIPKIEENDPKETAHQNAVTDNAQETQEEVFVNTTSNTTETEEVKPSTPSVENKIGPGNPATITQSRRTQNTSSSPRKINAQAKPQVTIT